MIRNSVDHGIESMEERTAAGKDAQGAIHLRAFHEGSNIIIEIEDDGKGLDREAIWKKAIEQGLVKEGEVISEQEIFNLILQPGFTTAKQVTEISGRGVGMDVVRRNIEAMRGRISISSNPGQGSDFKLALPLTLAIIDGMLVNCGEERYIIPTLSVVESIQPDASMLSSFADRFELINVRGEIFPLLRLDQLFEVAGAKKDPTQCLVVVLETLGRKVGLMMDDVMMRQQVVIKNLEGKLKNSKYLCGAAILSDGRVGLILNVDEIGALADRKARAEGALGKITGNASGKDMVSKNSTKTEKKSNAATAFVN
jgi:two-component system, chemotaxis family, sensor kinase CheA